MLCAHGLRCLQGRSCLETISTFLPTASSVGPGTLVTANAFLIESVQRRLSCVPGKFTHNRCARFRARSILSPGRMRRGVKLLLVLCFFHQVQFPPGKLRSCRYKDTDDYDQRKAMPCPPPLVLGDLGGGIWCGCTDLTLTFPVTVERGSVSALSYRTEVTF